MNNEYKIIAPIEKYNGYILFFIYDFLIRVLAKWLFCTTYGGNLRSIIAKDSYTKFCQNSSFLIEGKLEDISNCGPEWFLEQLSEIIGEFQQAHNNFNQLTTELTEDKSS